MKIGYENWVYIPFIGHLSGSPGLNSYSGPGTSIPNGGSKLESRGHGTHLRCVIFGAKPTWHILLEVIFFPNGRHMWHVERENLRDIFFQKKTMEMATKKKKRGGVYLGI